MPELPEVETVCNGIRPILQHNRIVRVTLNRDNLRFPFPDDMVDILTNSRVIDVSRRAKYIVITLDTGHVWVTHLGMTGKFIITPHNHVGDNSVGGKHDHVVITMENGDTLIYNDPRRFGYMDLRGHNEPCPHTDSLGAEPLGADFSGDILYNSLKTRKSPLKTALLNQKIVAGLGNIYVCEALWQCALHPEKVSNTITKKQAHGLYTAIVDTLNRAIASGGSSLKDYRQADGSLGYFQHSWRAYGKENEPCHYMGGNLGDKPSTCGHDSVKCDGTITRTTQGGRSTFFCDTHQKKL